jgi:hypothetical protein
MKQLNNMKKIETDGFGRVTTNCSENWCLKENQIKKNIK